MVEDKKIVERQNAKIASIKEIITGSYIKQEGWEPNYILTKKNEKISRVNLIGIIVTVPENGQSVFVDDGSGKIEIRTFDDIALFNDVTIGDIILTIGRPRVYNDEIYINGEVVKKIENKGWLEYRKKEIMLKNILLPDQIEELTPSIQEVVEEVPERPSEIEEETDEIDLILMKIKELDKGEGCDVQELSESNPDAENVIKDLLLKGEIFEISPGKVKVLE